MNYFRAHKQLPTGFFCPLGGIADYLPYCAEKLKLKIPDDFSLIGYNRPEERNYVQPLQPFDSIGVRRRTVDGVGRILHPQPADGHQSGLYPHLVAAQS